MYKDNKTTEHKRDTRGNIIQEPKNNTRRGSGFLTAFALTMGLGLVLTGLLLHTSIQQNEMNLGRINDLEQENAVMRSSIEYNETHTFSADVIEIEPAQTTDIAAPIEIKNPAEPVIRQTTPVDIVLLPLEITPEEILSVDNGGNLSIV